MNTIQANLQRADNSLLYRLIEAGELDRELYWQLMKEILELHYSLDTPAKRVAAANEVWEICFTICRCIALDRDPRDVYRIRNLTDNEKASLLNAIHHLSHAFAHNDFSILESDLRIEE